VLLNPQSPSHLPQALADGVVILADPAFWDHSGYLIQGWQQPELPIIGSRLAAPLFKLTDRRLGAEADPEALRAAFGSLERPRFGSLRFWLRIAPPPAPPDPSDDLARRPSASSR